MTESNTKYVDITSDAAAEMLLEGFILDGAVKFTGLLPAKAVMDAVEVFRVMIAAAAESAGCKAGGAIMAAGVLPPDARLTELQRALVDFDSMTEKAKVTH